MGSGDGIDVGSKATDDVGKAGWVATGAGGAIDS